MTNLSPFLSPKSVAIIGASPDITSLRGRIMKVLLCHDFKGKVYPVSRSNTEIMGLKAYPSIGEVPETIDLAVLIIPAIYVSSTLEECAKYGVKSALILSSGFAEDSSEAGDALQKQLHDISDRTGMIISGPNSEGYANMALNLCPTFSPAVEGDDMALLPSWKTDRKVAVIAQSGGMGFSFYDRARPKNLPFSYVITTGNEACLETLDIVDYLIDSNEADVFIIFMEDVKTPSKLSLVAEKALLADKPIIITKIGHSDAGVRAAASHTASLAGSYEVYKSIFERYGIIEGSDIEEMVDIAAGFIYFGDRPPAGRRVGIFTASGGGGGWMADSCAASGLEVPILDPKTRANIDQYLPSYGTSQNPVDGTAGVINQIGYARISEMIAESPNVDTVVTIASTRVPHKLVAEQEKLLEVAQLTKKPIMFWSYTIPNPESSEVLAKSGFPLFTDLRNCTRTIAVMCSYQEYRKKFIDQKTTTTRKLEPSINLLNLLKSSAKSITEYDSMSILSEAGINAQIGTLTQSPEEAIAAGRSIATAVALKIQSPDIPHKSEAGGVILNITGDNDIKKAFNKIEKKIATDFSTATIQGILVQEMSKNGLEIILGISNKDGFGPILMVGFGGVNVEKSKDVVFAPVPIDAQGGYELIQKLKGAPLLNEEQYDINSLTSLMASLSDFAQISCEHISEIDLNPILLHPPGQGFSIIDALMFKH
jgi:acyl-CoA synthetase (NDP forming)